MADDSNFVALLHSLLSTDNDARTAAEVSVVMRAKKSIKIVNEKNVLCGGEKEEINL